MRWFLGGVALGALWGLLSGARYALTSDHVREFQAGDAVSIGEKLSYVIQRMGLEAAGFGLLFALVGLLGSVAALACPGAQPRRTWSGRLLALLALAAWAGPGAYFAREWLPFLSVRELWTLNAIGLLAPLLGLAAGSRLLASALGDRARDPLARTLGLLLGVGAGAAGALLVLRTAEPWQAPVPIALAGLALSAGAAATWPLANVFQGWLGSEPNESAAPRPQGRGVQVLASLGALAVLATFAIWRPSGTDAAPEYAKLQSSAPAGPNVIMLVVDTLRADALGCYGYERPTSPHIDAFAQGGTRFASASSPAAWTKPSTATLLTGLHPSRHGALHHGSRLRLPAGEQALAEVFRDAGLATAAFVTNPNIKRVFEFDRGFQEFFDSPVEDTLSLAALRDSASGQLLIRLSRHQFNWKYENDVFSMNEHVFAWFERNAEERFFLYLHYIDPHAPYAPPEPYRSEFVQDHGLVVHNERKRKVGRDLYDGEVRTFDAGFGQLLDRLKSHAILDNTVIAITSDHGEEWYEFGVVGHGTSLYEPVIGVPMILAGPGVPGDQTVGEPVQTLDLPATLLDLASVGTDRLGDGSSFAGLLDPSLEEQRALFLENEFGMGHAVDNDFVLSGMRRGPYKLILTERHRYRPPGDAHPAQEFYDLSQDPAEERNLIADPEHQERIGQMVRELMTHSEFLANQGLRDDGAPAVMDAATRDQLKALGYLGED